MNYVQGWYDISLTTVLYQSSETYKEVLIDAWEENNSDYFVHYMFHHTIKFFKHIENEFHLGKNHQRKKIDLLVPTVSKKSNSNTKREH